MIYRNIEDIPYPFIHDAVLMMDKFTNGTLNSVYVDQFGSVTIRFSNHLSKLEIQRCMAELDPYATSDSKLSDYIPIENEDYVYLNEDENDYVRTEIYSNMDIDLTVF